MAMYDGAVLFSHITRFKQGAALTGDFRRLGGQHDAAGFPVQPVRERDKARRGVQAQAGDQTGVNVPLGRVTHQPGWLMNHQQGFVFVEHRQHTRCGGPI